MQDGDLAGGAGQIERAYNALIEAKQRAYLTYLGTLVAAARLELGQFEDALAFLAEVEALSIETHQQMFIPDLHRLRGDALRRLDPKDGRIEVCYDSALSLADRQGAPALAERARRSRAAWLREGGRQAHSG
jgi:predicted ATPase